MTKASRTLFTTLLLAAFLAGPAVAQQTGTLSTDVPNNGSGGVFIDLTALSAPLTIDSFDVAYTGTEGTTVEVEVWVREGSYVGFSDDPAGWTLTQTVEGTRLGTSVLSPLVLDEPIQLAVGNVTGVYLHAVSAGGGIRYNGTGANPPQTTWTNDDLELFGDVARTGATSFAGTAFDPRTFAGNVNYTIGAGIEIPESLPVPTLSTIGLILLALALLALGLVARRRFRAG